MAERRDRSDIGRGKSEESEEGNGGSKRESNVLFL
jgi:hypothetical protein